MKKIATVFLATVVLALGLTANASKYVQKPGTGRPGTAGNVGVRDENFGRYHLTELVLDGLSLGNFTNGNSANGVLLYTLPTGAQVLTLSRIDLALTASNGDMVNDTPDTGVGTVKATGSVNVLSGTATFENILTGQTAADANGSSFNGNAASVDLFSNTSGTKTIYLNAADAWDGNGSVSATGKVQVLWYDLID